MAQLALMLLGPLQATLDGVPIAGFESQKVRALLAYLALEAERPHARDALAGLLWPNQPDQDARNNLRQALANLRQALSDQRATPPYLQITRETIQFNHASAHQIDVVTFTELLTACDQHPHRHAARCRSCAQRRQQAVDVYQGDFLADFFLSDSAAFEEWAVLMRERLHGHALTALTQLADYHERRGAYAHAQHATRRQLELDPWREESHRQLMRVLALSGQRSAALVQYATCQRVLAAELGVDPEEETTVLAERIKHGEVLIDAQPGRAPSNLAAHTPPTPLIGRETELAQLADHLEDRYCRLLTLVGTGGIGKTRLALQAAVDLGVSFPDGVAFVALALVQSGEFIISAIADALGFVFHGSTDPKAQLLVYLRTKDMLLVLDNCEHLLTAAPIVSELLAACPDLVVLATSRAPLHVRGEQQFPVPPLALPPADDRRLTTDHQHRDVVGRRSSVVAQYAAVQLFLQRAQAVQPTFAVTAANAPDVAAICTRLDGLPLAIELAAARVKLFAPAALLARLEQRLVFLTGGPRDVPVRQQTIRNTIAWSHELLNESEQTLFRRLAVFVGGCTLLAAEEVCKVNGDASLAVVDDLATLVDQSLVRQEEDPTGEPRFVILETIREYALERLDVSGEAGTLRQRHIAYYLMLAKVAQVERVRNQKRAAEQLAQEHANLLAALTWSQTSDEAGLAVQLVDALLWFWDMSGEWWQLREWLQTILLRAPAGESFVNRARRLEQAAGTVDDPGQEQILLEESLASYRVVKDKTRIAWLLFHLGNLAYDAGDVPRATQLHSESLLLARDLGEKGDLAAILRQLGTLAREDGEYARATALFVECLTIRRELADTSGIATVLNGMGDLALAQGDVVQAWALYQEAHSLFQAIGHRMMLAWVLRNLGRAAHIQGDDTQARLLLEESLMLFPQHEWPYGIGCCLDALAGVTGTQRQPERAARLFGAGQTQRQASSRNLQRPWPIGAQVDYERDVAAVRAQLDVTTFAAAWAAGQALTLEQAIAEALGASPIGNDASRRLVAQS